MAKEACVQKSDFYRKLRLNIAAPQIRKCPKSMLLWIKASNIVHTLPSANLKANRFFQVNEHLL